jgi:hypothetical protein
VLGRLALLTTAILGLMAAVASAATPVTVGPGDRPRVSVDATGAGHVTWIQVAGNTNTQRPGSTISLRARAFIKVKRGKSPKKSIRAKVRICGA